MKILYVDYIEQEGHVNFHRIHIDALRAAGHEVRLVLHESIARQLPYPASDYDCQLPASLRKRRGRHPVANRLIYLTTLAYLKLRLDLSRYDEVLVGYVDEVTYGMLPLSRRAHIYAHTNGRTRTQPAKWRWLQRLAPEATFIVFNEYMAEVFRTDGFPHVKVISHGCVSPFPPASAAALKALELPITDKSRVVFHPSGKCHPAFMAYAATDSQLHEWLRANDVHLVLRGAAPAALPEAARSHIHFLQGFMPTEGYQALFRRADVILTCYPESFHHQVSGVSFECVAHGSLLLALDTPALDYVRTYYNYDPLFVRPSDFLPHLKQVLSPDAGCRCIVTPDSLTPAYADFF